MSNTPVREIPYRTIMALEDGTNETEVIVFAKVGADLHIRIDDERSPQNGSVLIVSIEQ